MASKGIWKVKDKVALASDIKYRGEVTYATNSSNYGATQDVMYTVQWKNNGAFLYTYEALISEKEANEIQAKLDAEKKEKELPKEVPTEVK